MPRNLPLSDTTDMKGKIKRQDVQHSIRGPSTEKIDCQVKFRELKDLDLSLDVGFSSILVA